MVSVVPEDCHDDTSPAPEGGSARADASFSTSFLAMGSPSTRQRPLLDLQSTSNCNPIHQSPQQTLRLRQIAASQRLQDHASREGKPVPSVSIKKRFRVNRLLGRLVPLLLLVYVGFAWDLVVRRYAYGYLYTVQNRKIFPVLWLVPAHLGLFATGRSYLRIFLAHSSSRSLTSTTLLQRLTAKLGATFPEPDGGDPEDYRDRIVLCRSDGEPLRCWRDECGGRVKNFRMRHCGDCRTCRSGFDHHCVWFDNDVTVPATLRTFFFVLLSIPPLLLWALGPLVPIAVQHVKEIWALSKEDKMIQEKWWNRWYSWLGGPIFRWSVGWFLAGTKVRVQHPSFLKRASPRTPLVVGFGMMFIAVITMLATSSLRSLARGRLTVDVERENAYRRLSAGRNGKNSGQSRSVEERLKSLSPTVHFRVPISQIDQAATGDPEGHVVVPISADDDPFHFKGWRSSLHFFLFESEAEISQCWPLHETLEKTLVARAKQIYAQGKP